MKDVLMYCHKGSGNHGCEAIIRGTMNVLNNAGDFKYTLVSENPSQDIEYGIGEKVNVVKEQNPVKKNTFKFVNAYLDLKIKKDYTKMNDLAYEEAMTSINKNGINLSIGGDNYCYGDHGKYIMLHNLSRKHGNKTVLWGCSVDEDRLENPEIIEDFKSFDLIVARETITYNNMIKKGLTNVKLYPDVAFTLQIDENMKELPPENTVGINLSPLIMNYETNEGNALASYEKLVEYILKETNMNVALVPHVIWEGNDDRVPLKKIYDKFKDSGRVYMIGDYNCTQLKAYISKCRFFIGARTHATIAAYSTCVPTLVVGYSVKSKGIAKDIFGTYDKYVIPVQDLTEENLVREFKWMFNNEKSIKNHLEDFIPEYRQKSLEAGREIANILGDI
ncbi:MAG: hypothetical protein DBY41_05450 [Clostridium sp.]|nr:MAG: hypothetical protein DBY41_05450 [Clostridium sp.]